MEGQAPKERLIQKYMAGSPQPGSLFDPSSTLSNSTPLGKNVTQLELSNPEARAALQNILEVQVREKRERQAREYELHMDYQRRIKEQAEYNAMQQQINEN